jgi:spermidine synthase
MQRQKQHAPYAPIIRHNRAAGEITYLHGGAHQSVADENGISLADYIHAMFDFLFQLGARDVLMIGCGGGTLATMLDRIGARVTVVDIDPRAFKIARRHFHFPKHIETHVADGARYLRRDPKKYDAIVLDAFIGHSIPPQFLRAPFLKSAKAHLKRGGMLLLNSTVDDDEDRTPDDIARKLKKIWKQVRLLDSDGWVDRNAVLCAGAVRSLTPPLLRLRPVRGQRKLERHIAALEFRKLR